MSSFADDQDFAESLVKGGLAEILFERLAVHSGWWVQHLGEQYRRPISPETKTVDGGDGAPDFKLSRRKDFSESITVEVKFQTKYNTRNRAHKKGGEDFRVVLSPEGHSVYPKDRENELGIAKEDWDHARVLLRKIFVKADTAP